MNDEPNDKNGFEISIPKKITMNYKKNWHVTLNSRIKNVKMFVHLKA